MQHATCVSQERATSHEPRATNRGQALLELAIVGAVALWMLSFLVNYGLQADYRQQDLMASFRLGLASAAQAVIDGHPTSVTHVVVNDRHVPVPSHPFAIGPTTPLGAASGAVSRDYRAHETAETDDELPRVRLTIQGQDVNCPSARPEAGILGCTTSGFRQEPITNDNKDKYQEIYGSLNAHKDGQRVLDACEGEIISFEGCVRQARIIVDEQVCIDQCERGKQPGSKVNCPKTCRQAIPFPWYAQGATEATGTHEDGRHRWTFPALEALVPGRQSLGLQPGYVKERRLETALAKSEDAAGVSTQSIVLWQEPVVRVVLFKPLGQRQVEVLQVRSEAQPSRDASNTLLHTTSSSTPWD